MSKQNPHKGTDIHSPFQLLVEGNDDRNFFEALLRHMGIDEYIQIQNFEGKDRLRIFLSGFVLAPKFHTLRRIGIVRDADENATGAFDSICSALDNENLPVPEKCKIFVNTSPSVGIMIFPGDAKDGMLETLLCRTIAECPENDCIAEFFKCLEELEDCDIVRKDKAWAHAYLATRPRPEVSVGFAAKKGYWNFDHDEFAVVRNFLTELAGTSNLD